MSGEKVVQMGIPIPLMCDRTEGFQIPIKDFVCVFIVNPPLLKGFGPQGTQIVDNALALFPNNDFSDRFGILKFSRIVEIIVKALCVAYVLFDY